MPNRYKMQRQSIIVITKGDLIETWGSLKKACNARKWKYSTLGQRKLPTEHEGYKIHRTLFNEIHTKTN